MSGHKLLTSTDSTVNTKYTSITYHLVLTKNYPLPLPGSLIMTLPSRETLRAGYLLLYTKVFLMVTIVSPVSHTVNCFERVIVYHITTIRKLTSF